MTIGEKIKKRRIELGLSADELADILNVNRSTIYRYESDEIEKLPVGIIKPLAEALKTTGAYLMGWEEQTSNDEDIDLSQYGIRSVKKIKLPLLGSIACGEPIFADEEKGLFVDVNETYGADFCLTAKGDSMINARILDGDIVFIRSQPIVEDGEIAAVIIDDEATLKRFYYYKDEGKVILQAENPRYKPLVYTGEELNTIRVLGKAVAFQSGL